MRGELVMFVGRLVRLDNVRLEELGELLEDSPFEELLERELEEEDEDA